MAGVWSCLCVCTHVGAEGIVAHYPERSSVVRNSASDATCPHRRAPRATSQLAANNGRAATDSFRYLAYCPLLVDVTW